MGQLKLAQQDFEKAIEVAGSCTCALRERAEYFERQHELQLALQDLDRAREIEPDNPRILEQRIRLQASLGAYDGALEDLQTLRHNATNSLTMRPLEGMLWQLKGDFAKAKDVYREFVVGRHDCCRLCMRLGDFAGALEDCDAIIADQQGRASRTTRKEERDSYLARATDARRSRGYSLEQLGRLEEALADYTEWSNAKPTNRIAHLSRARVLKSLNREDEAAAEMAKAMDIDKLTCTNFTYRGMAKEVMGDLHGALDDYIAADHVHGKCGASLALMASIHATAPDADLRNGIKAVDLGERSIPFKGFPPGRSKDEILAAAYAEAGNFEEAARQIEKCMRSRDSHGKRALMPALDRYRRGIPTRSEPWEAYLP
jgi:tetratricopeptide (TPR) repeat protein